MIYNPIVLELWAARRVDCSISSRSALQRVKLQCTKNVPVERTWPWSSGKIMVQLKIIFKISSFPPPFRFYVLVLCDWCMFLEKRHLSLSSDIGSNQTQNFLLRDPIYHNSDGLNAYIAGWGLFWSGFVCSWFPTRKIDYIHWRKSIIHIVLQNG